MDHKIVTKSSHLFFNSKVCYRTVREGDRHNVATVFIEMEITNIEQN